MTESIGIKINEIVSQFVDVYLAEAETEEYPYAVYTSTITPVYTKDGIDHYQSDVVITIYDKDLDAINPIASKIQQAIISLMSGGKYSSRQLRDYSDCTDGVWSRELSYTINQYN